MAWEQSIDETAFLLDEHFATRLQFLLPTFAVGKTLRLTATVTLGTLRGGTGTERSEVSGGAAKRRMWDEVSYRQKR